MKEINNVKLKRHPSQNEILVFGLPVKLFALACLFSGFGLLLSIIELGWIIGGGLGLLFFVIVFTPLRWIHQDDPQAWLLWLDAIKHSSLSSNTLKKKTMSVLSQREVISFKSWSRRNK